MVIGGLFTSTMLTLIVVPVVYSILDSIRHRITRRGSGTPADEAPETPATRKPASRNWWARGARWNRPTKQAGPTQSKNGGSAGCIRRYPFTYICSYRP